MPASLKETSLASIYLHLKMAMQSLLFVVVLAILFMRSQSAVYAEPSEQADPNVNCLDHAGIAGSCGPIIQCPSLFRLIDGRRPTPDELSFLRGSQCGRQSGLLHMCCAYSAMNPFPGSPEAHPARKVLDKGSVCGASIATRITGGLQVSPEQHPWLALIGYTRPNSTNVMYECSGALISTRHVLTAAHCVTKVPGDFQLHSVRLGEGDLSRDPDCDAKNPAVCPSPQEIPIASLFIHEDYQKPFRLMNDLALLTLSEDVLETTTVGKICLPFGARRDTPGTPLIVAGFGRIGSRDGPSSDVPLEITIPVVEHRECADAIALLGGRVGPRQMCAGGRRGTDVCFGDSGAPLIAPADAPEVASTVQGIVAFGDRSCQGRIPGVFTRVSAYLNWILDRVNT